MSASLPAVVGRGWPRLKVGWSLLAILAGAEAPAEPPRLTVLSRAVSLERTEWAYWQVDYHLRNDGPRALTVTPAELTARVEGSVSNSRVPGHEHPLRAQVEATGSAGLTGSVELVAADDDIRRCRERLVLQAWPAARGETPTPEIAMAVSRPVPAEAQPTLSIPSGEGVRVRLRLEHVHALYGPFDALLGERELTLQLGSALFRDRLPMNRQGRPTHVEPAWPPDPPEELRDARVFLSAPDSLHLEASVPGKQTHRFPDFHGVRHGGRFRLSFWYLVAAGSDGDCRVRLTQYRDLPSSFRTLHNGEVVEHLTVTGRWVRVERIIRAEPEATAIGVDAGIVGVDIAAGSLWIDDLRLEPLDEVAVVP